jgi:hypothetical protein
MYTFYVDVPIALQWDDKWVYFHLIILIQHPLIDTIYPYSCQENKLFFLTKRITKRHLAQNLENIIFPFFVFRVQ